MTVGVIKPHGNGYDRWEAKRKAGISPVRSDGSLTSAETDTQAFGAEREAAKLLGCKFNDAVYSGGDGGHDFEFSLSVEVYWIGVDEKTGTPRQSGHLIVNPHEPWRWADLYVVMAGSEQSGYKCLGWTTHKKLTSDEQRNFGYGPRFAMHTSKLEPIERLLRLKVNKQAVAA